MSSNILYIELTDAFNEKAINDLRDDAFDPLFEVLGSHRGYVHADYRGTYEEELGYGVPEEHAERACLALKSVFDMHFGRDKILAVNLPKDADVNALKADLAGDKVAHIVKRVL